MSFPKRTLGWKDSLKWEMATHSTILAWEIPWTESLEGCSPWGCKESDMTEHICNTTRRNTKIEHLSVTGTMLEVNINLR